MAPSLPVTLVSAGLRLESPGGKKVPTRRNNNIFYWIGSGDCCLASSGCSCQWTDRLKRIMGLANAMNSEYQGQVAFLFYTIGNEKYSRNRGAPLGCLPVLFCPVVKANGRPLQPSEAGPSRVQIPQEQRLASSLVPSSGAGWREKQHSMEKGGGMP